MFYRKLTRHALLAAVLAAGNAVAAPIAVDAVMGPYVTANSSIATEVGLVNTAFGVTLTNYAWAKVDGNNVAASFITAGNTAPDNSIAYTINWQAILAAPNREDGTAGTGSFSGSPSYFLLKFGGGNGNGNGNGGGSASPDTFVFRNSVDLPSLTFSSSAIGGLDLGRLSHITIIDEPGGAGTPGGNPVPEPATLALLGAGFAGLVLRRRRR